MKIAVISDIHGNLEAFVEVLKDARGCGAKTVFCLGDNIGYGPDPEAVVQMISRAGFACTMGNHELGLTNRAYLEWFNPQARQALVKTGGMLSETSLAYIEKLPYFLVRKQYRLVHGLPPASATDYLFQVDSKKLAGIMRAIEETVCFVGHTHLLELVWLEGEMARRRSLSRETLNLDSDKPWIINVGSVGQPRDGDPHAKYVLFDDETRDLEVRYVPYDIQKTADKIRRLGLPEHNALRLGKPVW